MNLKAGGASTGMALAGAQICKPLQCIGECEATGFFQFGTMLSWFDPWLSGPPQNILSFLVTLRLVSGRKQWRATWMGRLIR